jgi:hypothetical protein
MTVNSLCRTAAIAVWASLTGLGCSGHDSPVAAAQAPEKQSLSSEGYFSGSAATRTETRYSEALITNDGLVRVLIANGTDLFAAADSLQFLGTLVATDNGASGQGIVIGQGCTEDGGNPFCGQAASASIVLSTVTADQLSGQISIETESDETVWDIDMIWPTTTYLESATLARAQGVYQEELAEFAHSADTLMSVDGNGLLFFQSAGSSCVGNGSLSPYADGGRNVYYTTLTIEICDEAHSVLNGVYEGLATRSVGVGDDEWGDWLVVWLATSECTESKCAALTLWGSRI